ncbi:MAG: DUF342 domain-containing protein [Deltaproteobacteria bacterium]|nr:DUF342 domain-containing protein [Candidatus Anaeroferrophillacea bacterium]
MFLVHPGDDLMTATVEYVPDPENTVDPTVTTIIDILRNHKVTAGIDQQMLDDFCTQIRTRPDLPRSCTAARGTPFEETVQPRYQFRFATKRAIGQQLESGRIDYHDRGMVNYFKAGSVLLEIIPGRPGTAAVRVDGTTTEPAPLRPTRAIKAGKNVTVETTADNRQVFTAAAAGQAQMDGTRVSVENLYQVDGDVDLNTGHVKYQGPIRITGNVLAGFTVMSNSDIFVDKLVDGGTIKTKGNLVVGTGIVGSDRGSLTVYGNVKSEYITGVQHCTVRGTIVAEKHIINSRLRAGAAIRCGGKITGDTHVSAFSGIETGELGAESGNTLTVEVGNDAFIRERLAKIEDALRPLVERSIALVDKLGMPVILNQDISRLPPERRETGAVQLKEYLHIDQQVNLLKQKKVELEEKSAAAHQARVTVHQAVHPGVVIRIGRETYQVDKAIRGFVEFRLDPDTRRITTR